MTDTNETTKATEIPHVTVDGTSYSIESLTDRAKTFISDMVRTTQEYNALVTNYRQSVTLTTSYSSSLKDEVKKADLPIDESNDQEKPTITIDDNRYDASEAPDSVKQYVSDLTNSCRQKNNLEFRLRQLDAARNAYFSAIKDEIQNSGIAPMDPQPEKQVEGTG